MNYEELISTLKGIAAKGKCPACDKSEAGKDGDVKWITTHTGAHIPIKNGRIIAPRESDKEESERGRKAVLGLFYIPARGGYKWDTKGIVRIGRDKDIAAYTSGDFKGKCVVYCHGQGGDALSGSSISGFLDRHGISLICPDYRGVGLTNGEFTEEGLYEAAHSAYDWLVKEKGVSPSDIISMGYSLGTGPAAELASTKKIGGMILQAPFKSADDQVRYLRGMGFINPKMGVPQHTDACRTVERAKDISCPSLVFHGTHDTTVPYSQGKAVYDAIASKNKEMVTVRGGDHCGFMSQMGVNNYLNKLKDFISHKV